MGNGTHIERLLTAARSSTINKWVGRITEETDLVTEGDTPTARMEDLIVKLKQSIESGKNIDESVNLLIKSAYGQGVQAGFSRALLRFMDGSITTQKKRNEDEWVLSSASDHYQITAELPAVNNGTQKTKVIIRLSEHGFE